MSLEIVILAAGQGTRMRSNLPKVLHPLAGKPMLAHVIETAQSLEPEQIHVVYGHHGEQVKQALANYSVNWVYQEKQLGTGHAVLTALPFINADALVLVLSADVPLISDNTLQSLLSVVPQQGIGIVTAELADPRYLGRVVRDSSGNITRIVEHKDASETELAIHEIYSGIMATRRRDLDEWLPQLDNNNAQNEYYLTQLFELIVEQKFPVLSVLAAAPTEVQGVNDRVQLSQLERCYQLIQVESLMRQGVTIMDPARIDIRGQVNVERDVTLDVNVVLAGDVSIGSNSTIGPNVYLRDVTIGENVKVEANSVLEEASVASDCVVGPFARLRPGAHLETKAKVGNFVEVKKSVIGKGSKVNHLSYIGDATLGEYVNVGAGTITCNYDGYAKHTTIIGDYVQIGSNTSLVAPLTVGSNATIGAGSTITKDAPSGKLSLSRSKQQVIENWAGPISQRKTQIV